MIYGRIKADIGQILVGLCEHKGVELVEESVCKEHIYFSNTPYKLSVSQFMR